jgi:hypothetical protein
MEESFPAFFRERNRTQPNATERNRTQPNATERKRTQEDVRKTALIFLSVRAQDKHSSLPVQARCCNGYLTVLNHPRKISLTFSCRDHQLGTSAYGGC